MQVLCFSMVMTGPGTIRHLELNTCQQKGQKPKRIQQEFLNACPIFGNNNLFICDICNDVNEEIDLLRTNSKLQSNLKQYFVRIFEE